MQRRKQMPKSGTKLVNAQKQNGQSFFYFFAPIFRNTHIKLVLVFGIARIVFVGAHALIVTKTGASQAN